MRKFMLLLGVSVLTAVTLASCTRNPEVVSTLDVDPKTLTFTAIAAPVQTVAVKAENVVWDIKPADVTASWLHVEKKEGAVAVTVDENPLAEERKAKFTITSNVTSVAPVEVSVTQTAREAGELDAYPRGLKFPAFIFKGDVVKTIKVTAKEGMAWDVKKTEEMAWIEYSKDADVISVSVKRNAPATERSGKLFITSDDPAVDDIEITVEQENGDLRYVEGNYWANVNKYFKEVNAGEFALVFVAANVNEDNKVVGDGYGLYIDFLAKYPLEKPIPEIPNGKYEVNGRREAGSLITNLDDNIMSGIKIWREVEVEDGKKVTKEVGQLTITGGWFTVERKGDSYNFVFDLNLSDGSKFEGSYTGPVKISHQDLISTLRHDIKSTMRDGGGVANAYTTWSGASQTDGSWEWVFWLWGKGITWEPENRRHMGYGDLMRLSIFHDPIQLKDRKLLPAGRYPISLTMTKNTTRGGGWDNNSKVMEGMYGSWYLEWKNWEDLDGDGRRDEGEYGALRIGYVDIAYNNATETYKIIVDATDDFGNKIDVDFEGAMVWNYNEIPEENPDDENWILMAGTKWAKYNVGAPGTFVEKETDYGMLYQFGKTIGWDGTTPTPSDGLFYRYYGENLGWGSGDGAINENFGQGPCPKGYTLPTEAQYTTLCNLLSYNEEIDGVKGREFAAVGAKLFFPYAGSQQGMEPPTGPAADAGNVGFYWMNDVVTWSGAAQGPPPFGKAVNMNSVPNGKAQPPRPFLLSVRCVKVE